MSCATSHVRCRTCDVQISDVRHRRYDVVRHVNIVCRRTISYDRRTTSCQHIVYDIIVRQSKRTTSYVQYVRCRMYISYTISYVPYLTYDVVCRRTISYVQCYIVCYMNIVHGHTISYTTSYTIFYTVTIHSSACLAPTAKRRRFKVSAPLRLDS